MTFAQIVGTINAIEVLTGAPPDFIAMRDYPLTTSRH